MKTIFVGMSGGVDSSLSAALLKEQGHHVVGVYMKNWTRDMPGLVCPWKQDYQDAKRVAAHLGIELLVFDFQKEYQQKVVDYMLDEYKSGRTPNPDIMCNQEVKFKLFLDTAIEQGADMIATGHYARSVDGELHVAENKDKDQTYFLYRVSSAALHKTLFPLGDISTKAEVRAAAAKRGLATADKKDSQGICFVGKVGIRDFLSQYVEAKPGPIVSVNGDVLGEHDGAIFYTIGQRHGLDLGGGLPYYVIGKDMAKNEVYVTTDLDDQRLWHDAIKLADVHWIGKRPELDKTYQIRTRYRAPLIEATLVSTGRFLEVGLTSPIRAITPGQSAVIYDGSRCLGGGILV